MQPVQRGEVGSSFSACASDRSSARRGDRQRAGAHGVRVSPHEPLAASPGGTQTSASAEAESWFLQRGLPSVLTTRGRWRRLWSRSAPVLAAYATIAELWDPDLSDHRHATNPASRTCRQPTEWVVLGIVVAALPLATLVGWLVSRIRDRGARGAAGMTAAAVIWQLPDTSTRARRRCRNRPSSWPCC